MAPVRSILAGIVMALLAYAFSPAKLLDVMEGDAIVVTGSHTGIGKHAALTLVQNGYTVFACVRKVEHGDELLETAKQIKVDASKLKPILLDVTKSDQIAAAVETVAEFVGDRGLYGLFNNAGIGFNDPQGNSVEQYPMEYYRQTFDVNFFGLVETTKAFLPLIRRRKGRIINNTSISGFMAGPFTSAYASSKFAVEALSNSLRRELYPHGVKVSVLEPGFVKTPILKGYLQEANKDGPYAQQDIQSRRQGLKLSLDAASPQVTSEAVVHAMRAPRPKTRYIVGYLSQPCRFLALLPDAWLDTVMRYTNSNNIVSDLEMKKLMATAAASDYEFEF